MRLLKFLTAKVPLKNTLRTKYIFNGKIIMKMNQNHKSLDKHFRNINTIITTNFTKKIAFDT